MLWLSYSLRLDDFLETFGAVATAAGVADDPRFLDWYGSVAIDAQAIKLLGHRALAKTRRGAQSDEQLILKLFGSEAVQRSLEHAVETLGPLALDNTRPTGEPNHLQLDAHNSSWFDQYLRSFAGTIAGGTSEIQRNIVAQGVLGLPR
jgi:alkylation response protein AidB-like acyl-CoA dehydrogenase